MAYDIIALNRDLERLKAQGARVFTIGYTQLGRPIPCVVKGGSGGGQTLLVATTHAREYITTPLVMEMMYNYSGSAGVWCVPMLNIDGAMLCQFGLDSLADETIKANLLAINGGSYDFSLWKANIRAVDLNVNFNANWGTGTQNVTYPAPANYIGEYPVSESENIALRNLTLKLQPNVMLSYHTRGEIIYWGYECIKTYRQEADIIGKSTGYPILESNDSAGGFKDWFVATTFKLGLTMEVVGDSYNYPLPLDLVPQLYQTNKNVLNIAADIAVNEVK